MPRRIPAYRHYKPKNLGLVVLDGRQHYLGAYNSPESLARYHQLVHEWLSRPADAPASAAPAPLPLSPGVEPTIGELILAFWEHARQHYRHPNGTPTGELENYRDALRPLRRLFGAEPAHTFDPLKLRALRDELVRSNLARTTVNARVAKICRVCRWGASMELVPASVYESLATVDGLRAGRCAAREPEPVRPVPEEHVTAILGHVPPTVRAMIEVQMLTGARPGEIVRMRIDQVDRSGPVWVYRPDRHKTGHKGRPRAIPIGPRAQAVLGPWLEGEPDAYVFRPAAAESERHALRRRDRRSPMTPSQRRRRPKDDPKRAPGDCYDTHAYRRAIARACRAVGVPTWHPNQLRHLAATRIRCHYDLEAAQVVLGHARADITQIYAERDLGRAARVMAEIG